MGKKRKKHGPEAVPAAPPPPAAAKPPRAWLRGIKYAIYSLIPVTVLLALGETGARFIPGDLQSKHAFYVAGGHEEYFGTQKLYVPYRVLPPYHWLPVPHTPITNNRGFRGHDWSEAKPAGTVRIACLGDSCTLGGQEPYAQRLERLLGEALGNRKYEVLNAGVGSSSTYQMIQILEQYVLPMRPDLVVVFPGWNDRWVHDGQRDSLHQLPTEAQQDLRNRLMKSRLFKALAYYADEWRRRHKEQRVPPAESRENLRKIARLCRQNGVQAWFCTVPSGCTEAGIRSRFAEDRPRNWDNDLYDIYRDKGNGPVEVWDYISKLYADVIANASRDEDVPVIDLVGWMRERAAVYTDPALHFFKDGIHFSELGLQEVARRIAVSLMSGGEADALNRYLDSVKYFMANAPVFMSQFQFAAADDFLNRAVAAGESPDGEVARLRGHIVQERPFYDLYDSARMELSNGGEPAKALELFQQCLAMRPDEQNVRLDAADQAKGIGRFQLSLDLALGQKANYTPQNLNRALWIAVEAANRLGRQDLVQQILMEIAERFPNDARIQRILQASDR